MQKKVNNEKSRSDWCTCLEHGASNTKLVGSIPVQAMRLRAGLEPCRSLPTQVFCEVSPSPSKLLNTTCFYKHGFHKRGWKPLWNESTCQNLCLIYRVLLIFLIWQSLLPRISSGYKMGMSVSERTYGTIASWIFPQICLPAMTMVSCVVSSIKQPAGSHWWRQTGC